MAKRKKMIIARSMVKTILYTAPEPNDGERVRAAKSKMTTAAQKAMNDKTARGRLEMLLANNFEGRDLFITLTYRTANLPKSRAQAVANVRRFLKLLREYRKVRGESLKYIYVTEDKHGDGQLHHHLSISATERDIEVIRSLWPHGDIVDMEYIGSRDYETWALYMTKEGAHSRPVGAQMWTGSRNLEKPKVIISYVDNDTSLTVPVGCHIIEREEKTTEFGSYCYIKYRVIPNYWDSPQAPPRGAVRGKKQPLMSCL